MQPNCVCMDQAMTNLATSVFSSRGRVIVYWVTTALVVFELAMGGVWDLLRVPQVPELIERLGYPNYFLIILGDLEAAWRRRVGDTAVSQAEGVGLRSRALRFDGRCGIAVRFGADGRRHRGIPNHDDGCYLCVLGFASVVPPSRSE
jgi:hypothetical protein